MKTATFLSWLVVRQVVPSMSFSYQASKASATSDNSPITYDANLINKIASSAAKTERREVERQRGPRETCSRCSRPPDLCVCESLPGKYYCKTITQGEYHFLTYVVPSFHSLCKKNSLQPRQRFLCSSILVRGEGNHFLQSP